MVLCQSEFTSMLHTASFPALRRLPTISRNHPSQSSALCFRFSRRAGVRFFSLSTFKSQSLAPSRAGNPKENDNVPPYYQGPLASTFRRVKIFSLSSFALSVALAPFMFIIESSLPLSARFILAATAITTSGVSTALVSWCGDPYVISLRPLKSPDNHGVEGLEMTTYSLWLRKRVTRVYDTEFLVGTKRPLANWELAQSIQAPEKGATQGQEETVAETLDASGTLLGRWIVRWGADNRGTCRRVGKVVR
jgi:hypothetical protein